METIEEERESRRSIIGKHWAFLKKNFMLKHVSDALIQEGVITPPEWMSMREKQSAGHDIIDDFLCALYREKIDSFPKFVKALRNSGFDDIADVLDGKALQDKFQVEDTEEKTSKELNKKDTKETNILASLEKSIKEEGILTRKGVKEVKSEVDDVKSHVKSIQSDMDTMKTEVRAEVKAEMEEMRKVYKEQLEQTMKEHEKQIDSLTFALREKETSEKTIAERKSKIAKLQNQEKDLEEKKSQLQLELKDLRKQWTEANMKKSREENGTGISELVGGLQKSLDDRIAENEKLKKLLAEVKAEKIRLEKELEKIKAEKDELEEVIKMLRKKLFQKNRSDRQKKNFLLQRIQA